MSVRPYLGTNVNPLTVEEAYYRGLLEQDETLLALFDGVLLDEHGQRVGGFALSDLVLLTDQRVVTWARGFFGDVVDGFPWNDVDVADTAVWDPFHGRVLLALRLPPVAPRQRRINVKGMDGNRGSGERVFVNTLDYMPAADVPILAEMIIWVGEQMMAGVSGEELIAAFGETFPAPERAEAIQFMPAPEEEVADEDQPKRRWWSFGRTKSTEAGTLNGSHDLIAAYERERGGPTAAGRMMPSVSPGAVPSAVAEQPSMYDLSRGMRLMMEAPKRLRHTLRRATDAVSGANELIDSVKDPTVRRNALFGIEQAINNHERKQGPLSGMAPVMRAMVRFAEDPEPEAPPVAEGEEAAPTRRIQVKAAVRNRGNSNGNGNGATQPAAAAPALDPEALAEAEALAALHMRREVAARQSESNGNGNGNGSAPRRSISVRRAAPAAPEDAADTAADPPAVDEARARGPVRRISIGQSDSEEA